MGNEAVCKARFEGAVSTGDALLETEELRFKGDFRVVVPFAEIKSVRAVKGELEIKFPKGTLVLELGDKAEDWAKKIQTPKPLLDKLGVQEGMSIGLSNVDDKDFLKKLKERKVEMFDPPKPKMDIIFVQCDEISALKKLATLRGNIKPEGVIWVVYPKGQDHIKQEHVFVAGKSAGLVDVKVVAFSATHTGLKFVIPVARRKKA